MRVSDHLACGHVTPVESSSTCVFIVITQSRVGQSSASVIRCTIAWGNQGRSFVASWTEGDRTSGRWPGKMPSYIVTCIYFVSIVDVNSHVYV